MAIHTVEANIAIGNVQTVVRNYEVFKTFGEELQKRTKKNVCSIQCSRIHCKKSLK